MDYRDFLGEIEGYFEDHGLTSDVATERELELAFANYGNDPYAAFYHGIARDNKTVAAAIADTQ